MKRRKLIIAGTALAAIALATPIAFHLNAAQQEDALAAAAPAAPVVTISPVEERTMVVSEELTARVEATEFVDLRAEVAGRLLEVHFQAGQTVNAGDLLFTLDSREYAAAQAAAQAAVARAEAIADTNAREASRAEELFHREAISAQEADLRRSRATEAAAEVLAARAALADANLQLERTEIRAPIDGRVSRALVTAGNLVSPATPLTTLVSIGETHVYADVAEATVLKFQRLLREGRLQRDAHGNIPVELQLDDETGFPRRGYIESTDNRVSPATGTLLVRMVFPNTDQALIPGLYARVRIPLSAASPTLLISDRAIGTDQSQKFVLTVDANGQTAYRAVELGGLVDGKRIIQAGLQAGEHVIVNGLQRVRPGMTVMAQLEIPASVSSTGVSLAQR